MKKVVFVDIDGTLLNDNSELSSFNKEMIQQYISHGGLVVLCTGRDDKITRYVNFLSGASPYIISSNGALVVDLNKDSIVYESNLSKEEIRFFYDFSMKKKLPLAFNGFKKRYVNSFMKRRNGDILVNDLNLLKVINESLNQIVLLTADLEEAYYIKEKFSNFEGFRIANLSRNLIDESFSYTRESRDYTMYYFDIVKYDETKGKGISKLLQYLNLKKNDAAAMGDHINDLSMFDEVSLRIAVNNSYDKLLQKADYITLSNNLDGVGKALEKIIKNDIIELEK